MPEFLHARRDFGQLLSLIADERRIDPVLVEKDYWLMHCLWGLQAQGLRFELKGGTSLSKGFGIIHRFSEDIDIRIEPPSTLKVVARGVKMSHLAQSKSEPLLRKFGFFARDPSATQGRVDGNSRAQGSGPLGTRDSPQAGCFEEHGIAVSGRPRGAEVQDARS